MTKTITNHQSVFIQYVPRETCKKKQENKRKRREEERERRRTSKRSLQLRNPKIAKNIDITGLQLFYSF